MAPSNSGYADSESLQSHRRMQRKEYGKNTILRIFFKSFSIFSQVLILFIKKVKRSGPKPVNAVVAQ